MLSTTLFRLSDIIAYICSAVKQLNKHDTLFLDQLIKSLSLPYYSFDE